MRRVRTNGLVFGLTMMVGVGAVTLSRAQQAGEWTTPRASTRGEAQELVLRLRTEVDLLQLEYDATRECLLGWLRDQGKADLLGIDVSALLGTVKLEMGGFSGNAASVKEMSDLFRKLVGDNKEGGLQAMQETAKKGKDDLIAALDRDKQEFNRQVRLLKEEKLDLVEAEKQYQREAR